MAVGACAPMGVRTTSVHLWTRHLTPVQMWGLTHLKTMRSQWTPQSAGWWEKHAVPGPALLAKQARTAELMVAYPVARQGKNVVRVVFLVQL